MKNNEQTIDQLMKKVGELNTVNSMLNYNINIATEERKNAIDEICEIKSLSFIETIKFWYRNRK